MYRFGSSKWQKRARAESPATIVIFENPNTRSETAREIIEKEYTFFHRGSRYHRILPAVRRKEFA